MKEKILMPFAAFILAVGLVSFSGCGGGPDVDPDANNVGEEENLNEDPDDTGQDASAKGTDGKGEKQFTAKKKEDTGDDTGDEGDE